MVIILIIKIITIILSRCCCTTTRLASESRSTYAALFLPTALRLLLGRGGGGRTLGFSQYISRGETLKAPAGVCTHLGGSKRRGSRPVRCDIMGHPPPLSSVTARDAPQPDLRKLYLCGSTLSLLLAEGSVGSVAGGGPNTTTITADNMATCYKRGFDHVCLYLNSLTN